MSDSPDPNMEPPITLRLPRHQLTAYFVLTYVVSWAFLIPSYWALLNAGWAQGGLDEVPPLAFVGLIGAFGPTLAALFLSWQKDGRHGVRTLLRRVLVWRVQIVWYLFALLVPTLLFLIALLASRLAGFSPGPIFLQNVVLVVISAIAITLPFGPIPEELGWRGFALPRLLHRHGPIAASLIVGFFWTLWHVPAFFVPGVAIPSAFAVTPWTVLLYLLNNTALCLIFTGLYLRTKGSVLLAILLHAGSNASSNIADALFPAASLSVGAVELVYGVNIALMGLVGLALLIGRRRAVGLR
jgi:CAAX protease family protein